MITKNIALNIKTCLSGLSFSFDELILETKTLFENEGIPGFLKLLISLIDNIVVEHWKASDEAKCCSSPHLNRSGTRSKTIITSLGNINFEWTLLVCKNCKASHNPLKDFLGIEKNQKHSNEFEKICMEAVAENSFRRSTVGIIKTNENINFNHRSLHRWFMATDSDNISVKHSDLNVVLGDGTGFKRFVSGAKLERTNKIREKTGQKPVERSNRGEVRIVMGIKDDNSIVPLGAWTSESWKVIGKSINKVNNPNKNIAPKKVANILVADGEIGLNNGLGVLAHHQQRCLWHVPHELKPLMRYQEKAEDEDIKYTLDQVHSIFQLEIPEKDFEAVTIDEKVELNEKIVACELQMKLLAEYLEHKGYSKASTYVTNARSNLFTYLKYWMKTGVVTPKVTSKLERLMREIGRRIKKFAFNWSEKGCAKMTRIILKVITDPKSWEAYWDNKMKLSGNIRLSFEGVS